MNKNSLVKFSSAVSLFISLAIVLIKFYGWLVTDSLSLFSTLLDSFLDIFSSLLNFLAIRYSMIPPDDDHRFGHRSAEDLAIFTQSTFFALSGFFVLVTAIKRFFFPVVIEEAQVGMNLMYISITLTLILVSIQHYVIKKTNSNFIKADFLHYFTDLLTNIASLSALYLAGKQFIHADSIFSFFIAFYILYSSSKLLRGAFHNLMDRELEDEQRKAVINILKNDDKIISFHDLKTRRSGGKSFVQVHLVMDGNLTISQGHDIVQAIEEKIREVIEDVDIIVHQDPHDASETVFYKD